MFIRVLGEEEAALAYEGSHPFSDVPWGDSYVAYAYSKGYAVGYGDGIFGSDDPVDAVSYVEFLLRAMGYSSADNTNLADTLTRARTAGVLTEGEAAALQTGRFLRADLVYISYYALEASMPDGAQILAQVLMGKGVFTAEAWNSARSLVTSQRI